MLERELWKQCHKDEGRNGVEKPLLVISAWGTAGATVLILLVPLGNVSVFSCVILQVETLFPPGVR